MKELIEDLISNGVLSTPLIIEAFKHTDRIDFVPKNVSAGAYINEPLQIGHGQTISQPWTVAYMLELLEPKTGDKILDIGCGSGWQSALLSFIVCHDEFGHQVSSERTGKVIGLEIIPELANFANQNVLKYNYISKKIAKIHCLNAGRGYSEGAPFDKIIAAASGVEIPSEWKEQLKVGGIIVAPIGSKIVKLRKEKVDEFFIEEHDGFLFVPFVEK